MYVVIPALIVIIGLYTIAIYSPVPRSTEELLIGILAIAAVIFAAIFTWDLLRSEQE